MVDVKASCNTGNSAWAIVKPDILPPFRRQRLLSSGHERKKCKFHHNSNEGTKHITKNIHFMISSYWWFLFIQHILNCKWSHNARLICACSAWRSLAPNCCSSFFLDTASPCNVKSNNISSPTFISSHIKTPIPRGWRCPSLSRRHWYALNFFCCSICKSTQERGWLKKLMEMEAPSDALLMELWF